MDLQANRNFTRSDLECMLLDEAIEPKALPFLLLENITNDFSYKKEIGRGGFAVVYKGVLENGTVAVKRLSNTYKYESEFIREVECLMKVKHKNIVRFLGYCSDTQGHVGSYEGKFVMADVQERLLCLEYHHKGSLDKYIKDASCGLEWKARYRIIKGICEGLCYLHSINIMHLDLKPSNILMDDNMIPKITDFGLSRSLEEMQTRVVATKMFGTMGYLAPEFTSHVITHKFDLYSLGVIIMEMLTGEKESQVVENVLDFWDNRSELSQGNPHYEQIRVCAEIAIECTNFDPTKRPVSIAHIMDRLAETERMEVFPKNKKRRTEVVPAQYSCGVLQVHPLELRFPFKPNKSIACSFRLTNNTDEHVAFRLKKKGGSWEDYLAELPMHGIVPPRSTYTLVVTTREMEELPRETNVGLILQTIVPPFEGNKECNNFFEQVEKQVIPLNEVALIAICVPQEETSTKIIPLIGINYILRCLDAHPTEPWILMGINGRFDIWNYDTQSIEHSFESPGAIVRSTKIVARKQWVLTGDVDGYIHVYHCGSKVKKIRSLVGCNSSVASLAIHPTKPYMLSSNYGYIDLWDWDNDWKCIQTFYDVSDLFRRNKHSNQVAFNPGDPESFVSASWHTIKVWNLDSPESRYTLSGHSGIVTCLDFFTCNDQQYLITGSTDMTAKIWDMQEKTCIHTIEDLTSPFTCVISLPDRPYLVTGSEDGRVRLWSSSDFRLERIFDTGLPFSNAREVRALAYSMDSKGVVVGQRDAVTVFDLDDYEPVVIQGDNESSI